MQPVLLRRCLCHKAEAPGRKPFCTHLKVPKTVQNQEAGGLLDGFGNLFGTRYYGGSRYGYGTVYEITP